MAKKRKFTSQFKAEAVLESLRGDTSQSQAEICRKYNIAEDQLSKWKKQFLESAVQVFERDSICQGHLDRIHQLEQLAGKLTLELEISKKAFNSFTSRHNSRGGL